MQIIAHRGASGDFPENTLLAIEQALLQQADAIEIDVFSVEGELVVIHDHYLERTTNGKGNLSQFTLQQLQQLDAGRGEHIPTLWQVLQQVNGKCWLNIELKGQDTAIPLLQLLQRAQQELAFDLSALVISSFNHHLLQQIKQQKPELKTGALTANIPLDYTDFASRLQAYSVHLALDFINQQMVEDARKRGLKVYVYTVDRADDLLYMQQLAVDGVFTNHPARSRKFLNS